MKRFLLPALLAFAFILSGCASSGGAYLAPGEKLVKLVYHKEKSPKVREVFVAGDFNDWAKSQDAMTYDSAKKMWVLEIGLMPGDYAYKFVINGRKWIKPPKAQKYVNDGYGGKNALIIVD